MTLQMGNISKRSIIIGAVCLVIVITIVVTVVVVVKKGDKSNNSSISDRFISIPTSCGTVYEGLIHHVKTDRGEEKDMYEFRNIPYALPPVGKLRWRPPMPWNACDQFVNFKKDVIKCRQIDIFTQKRVGREDCLILSVRTPYNAKESKEKKKLPVLFWIHGGGMLSGSSYGTGYFPNEQFTASMDVVSVSINYRLNIFGFLSLKELWITKGKNESYGNYGIMDQILALKWVQNNIEYFGGDKNKVAIFGESGGGKAVYDLISSPLAKGLFSKAIPSSGYPISPIHTRNFASQELRSVLTKLNCQNRTDNNIVDCLQNASVDTVLNSMPSYTGSEFLNWFDFPFNVTTNIAPLDIIDYYVIPAPIGDIKVASNQNIDILVGSMAQEAFPANINNSWESLKAFLKPRVDSFNMNIYDDLIKLYYNNTRIGKVMPAKITPQYVYTVAASDAILSCQTNEIVRNMSMLENVTVYRYVVSQMQPGPLTKIPTAYHAIDTFAMFGNGHLKNPTKDDEILMLHLRKFFKEFIYSNSNIIQYRNSTIDFWNNTIVKSESPYHEKECRFMDQYGLLKRSWGQIGV